MKNQKGNETEAVVNALRRVSEVLARGQVDGGNQKLFMENCSAELATIAKWMKKLPPGSRVPKIRTAICPKS